MIHSPDAIIITVPMAFAKEYPGGWPAFEKQLEYIDRGRLTWWNTIASIPKHRVEFVYLIYDGHLQCRLTAMTFQKNVTKSFTDGGVERIFEHKNWVQLCGPVIKNPEVQPMRGFQGFRYTELLF